MPAQDSAPAVDQDLDKHVQFSSKSVACCCCCWRRKAHLNRCKDRELLYLKAYLLKIAPMQSLSALKHKKWEHMVAGEMHAEDRRLQQSQS